METSSFNEKYDPRSHVSRRYDLILLTHATSILKDSSVNGIIYSITSVPFQGLVIEFMVHLGMSCPLRTHPCFWCLSITNKSSDLVASWPSTTSQSQSHLLVCYSLSMGHRFRSRVTWDPISRCRTATTPSWWTDFHRKQACCSGSLIPSLRSLVYIGLMCWVEVGECSTLSSFPCLTDMI